MALKVLTGLLNLSSVRAIGSRALAEHRKYSSRRPLAARVQPFRSCLCASEGIPGRSSPVPHTSAERAV